MYRTERKLLLRFVAGIACSQLLLRKANEHSRRIAPLSSAPGLNSLLAKLAKLLGRGRARREAPEEPLYFGRLKRLSDDEWCAALNESPAKAALWVEAAATYGNVDAQLYWAQMLLDGYGTTRDAARAFRWFEIAAQSDRADALNMLGRCYERGWGVAADTSKAAEFYRTAADKADNWGRFNLACLLMEGLGVDRDLDAAYALLSKAADEGHAKSFYRVGLFHEHGWGRQADRHTASWWYRRSAEAGDCRGQYQYGKMLFDDGIRDQALMWISRSIDDAPAGFCREIAAELSDHQDPKLRSVARRAHDQARGLENRAITAEEPETSL